MKAIDFSNLLPGDILLITSNAMEGLSTRFGAQSDILHAMLYVGRSSVIDSTSDGVHARNLQKLFYEDDCAVYALRPITPPSPTELQAVISYARSVTGTLYSVFEAIRSTGKSQGKGSNKQFCSRLVARAYASADIKLVDNPDFCTPQQINDSPLLKHLPNPTIEISKEEIASIMSRPNRVTGMIDVTNDFLDKVRRFAPDVLKLDDAFQFLSDNRSFDYQLHDALKESGFLDFWRAERIEFYWRYDFEEMNRFASELNLQDDVTNYCRGTVQDFENGAFSHWENTLTSWKMNFHEAPLMSFKAMVALYKNLVEGSRLRFSVANQWLELHA